MQDADLVVVGGGYAGMACAASASARGVRTVVVDRKPEPGASPHTTGILVKEVADGWDVPRRLTRKVAGVRLYAPGGRSIDLHSPGYYFLATDTPGVLRWLARRASVRGADVRFGARIGSMARTDGRWRLEPLGLRAEWLVGADGARSSVARRAGLGINTRFLVGAESEFTGIRGVDEDFLHVFIDSRLAPGYIAWIVPGVGRMQVGLARTADRSPDLNAFLAQLAERFDLSRAREVSKRGGLIPVGGMVRPMAGERVMLVGDAAGMVSPLTAGGIQTALEYGRLSGVALADHLLDNGPDPARAVRSRIEPFGLKHAMRWAIDRRPPNALVDAMLRIGPVQALAQTVFFHHRGLMTRAAWRDLAAGCLGKPPARTARSVV
ncbi:MAG: NAD(P)/FAD-dependent oxidoreductase [Planctomycetota bacterium]